MSRAPSVLSLGPVLVAALACDPPPGESGGTGVTSQAMALPIGESVHPRWVLRDKDGSVVPALVEPYCNSYDDCRLPDLGANLLFRCAHVRVLKDRYIGLVYSLADGTVAPCAQDAEAVVPFSTCSTKPGCAGPFVVGGESAYEIRPHAPRTTFRFDDQLFYVSTSQEQVAQPCFIRDPVDGCVESLLKVTGFPLVPIPDEFSDLLAEGAPYTFEVAYD